ncbi:MoxR family ATPase [Candidatus Woesearchaeota archaeon]|nr:MoxR family ATPase [Candidatus Woesearchaeota archaeon]MBT5272282.1 MoxR family ATPase [Candidatus Woesearchaeota archaeon]MBT6041125.1 MoxR family ATPase [Candidatus Woesearchaeota archaeon]MBT6336554.1 MoxR family ATPase [Candidatus Woesearchaeota archaeon]MBT7927444.1 MoxR family ATPase [Candidatus Woesearchaeota archaeon]
MINIEKLKGTFDAVFKQINKVIIGQREAVEQILVAMLCDSNALLESYPGLGKTLTIKTLSEVMDMKYSRIQHTPDLMPSDITGTEIIQEVGGKRFFKFQEGPIFANILLADEINRATPKTQAALLEAMQEKQVTIGTKTHQLDKPFFVLATQNPIEQEGTYPLPEAQTDRFLLKITLDYPPYDDEVQIVDRFTKVEKPKEVKKILGKTSFLALQKLTRQVPIADDLAKTVVKIVAATRTNKKHIEYGASPRASLGLVLASKAHALMNGRTHVSVKDIEKMAFPVLRHRIILNFEAERKGMTTDDVIKDILKEHLKA